MLTTLLKTFLHCRYNELNFSLTQQPFLLNHLCLVSNIISTPLVYKLMSSILSLRDITKSFFFLTENLFEIWFIKEFSKQPAWCVTQLQLHFNTACAFVFNYFFYLFQLDLLQCFKSQLIQISVCKAKPFPKETLILLSNVTYPFLSAIVSHSNA